jgi:N-acetylmuramoyl-L-alanine amidase
MKIIVFGYGHLLNVDQGAYGILSEFLFNREYGAEVVNWLKIDGVECIDCTPVNAVSMADSLTQRVNKANASGAEYFASFHGDAYSGQAHGCEVIAGSQSGLTIGQRICDNLEKLGYTDRNAYIDRRGLYEIQHTTMVANIIEPLFVDNQADVDLYRKIGKRAFSKAIAEGIVGHDIAEPVAPAHQELSEGLEIYKELQTILNNNQITDFYGRALVVDGVPGSMTLSACKKATIYPGDKNSIVKWLQKFLGISQDGWYANPKTTGYHETFDAICKYQRDHGLLADGVVGPKTWAVILGLN